MKNDWHSGWREFKEAHPNMGLEEHIFYRDAFWEKFDYNRFVEHYDNLSDEEWQEVIDEAAKFGYDIRSVLCYKKEHENSELMKRFHQKFTIMILPEIIKPLEEMDGCGDFVLDSPDEGLDVYYRKEQMRLNIIERYQRFGLPIPKYWVELLW